MNSNSTKQLFSHKSDEWGTPKDLFNQLDKEFHFDLDPCSNKNNHKCNYYFTKKEDGLKQNWGGHTVFCNPPYSQISLWAEKSLNESKKPNTTVVMLVPSRTDTRWFHNYVYHKSEIRFIKGRLKFERENGESSMSAPFPSMIAIFK